MIYTHIAQEEPEADMKGLYIKDLYINKGPLGVNPSGSSSLS